MSYYVNHMDYSLDSNMDVEHLLMINKNTNWKTKKRLHWDKDPYNF